MAHGDPSLVRQGYGEHESRELIILDGRLHTVLGCLAPASLIHAGELFLGSDNDLSQLWQEFP